jgi:hypothetical protein
VGVTTVEEAAVAAVAAIEAIEAIEAIVAEAVDTADIMVNVIIGSLYALGEPILDILNDQILDIMVIVGDGDIEVIQVGSIGTIGGLVMINVLIMQLIDVSVPLTINRVLIPNITIAQ